MPPILQPDLPSGSCSQPGLSRVFLWPSGLSHPLSPPVHLAKLRMRSAGLHGFLMAATAPIEQPPEPEPTGSSRASRSTSPTPSLVLSPEERARRAAAFLQRGRIRPIRDLLGGTPGYPS